MMAMLDCIRPEMAWVDGELHRGLELTIASDGVIASIDKTAAEPTHDRIALLPGFVNSHSHSFQRALRGRGEYFDHPDSNFWSWRKAMYELVEEMDLDSMKRIATQAFHEMRMAGMTSVGEFHYLHHENGHDWAFDEIILESAREVGIRIVLLNAYYVSGGFGQPLESAQRRFDGESLEGYWANMDRLAGLVDGSMQQLGVVAHSIRAVPRDQLIALHEESRRRGLVFHMHVEEQRAEIEACREAYGSTPTSLLLDSLQLDDRFTAVHDTHTDHDDMARYLQSGSRVCLCPLTEANLGDGIADVRHILDCEGRICLGSDSNARISMIEEMRLTEYGQRLRHEGRGICRDEGGHIDRVLIDMATRHGADSLGLNAGRLEAGRLADFVLVDLDATSLTGVADQDLMAAVILGGAEECIAGTIVGGVA
ncbi:MAG: formimidoylglutamate deiminase [Phycisphaerales bacterium]|nr:formimidoylglutamate deiminase [Phycisphaerales bacterium]